MFTIFSLSGIGFPGCRWQSVDVFCRVGMVGFPPTHMYCISCIYCTSMYMICLHVRCTLTGIERQYYVASLPGLIWASFWDGGGWVWGITGILLLYDPLLRRRKPEIPFDFYWLLYCHFVDFWILNVFFFFICTYRFPLSCCFIYSFLFLLLCFYFDMLLKIIFQFTVTEGEKCELRLISFVKL